jgi:hypothetical protein
VAAGRGWHDGGMFHRHRAPRLPSSTGVAVSRACSSRAAASSPAGAALPRARDREPLPCARRPSLPHATREEEAPLPLPAIARVQRNGGRE